jgi:hypothetical protein
MCAVAEEGEQLDDPFGSADLHSEPKLAIPISKYPDGTPSWEETVADMLRVIAELTDPDDTSVGGRFKRDNRDTLEQMRQAHRNAWSTIEHRLGDCDRELRESNG